VHKIRWDVQNPGRIPMSGVIQPKKEKTEERGRREGGGREGGRKRK